MKRLLFLLVMQFAEFMLALLNVFMWVPTRAVNFFDDLKSWAWLKLQNMDDEAADDDENDSDTEDKNHGA
jgi:hypothetical protein